MVLRLDAYAETVTVPGMSFLGLCYGYLSGRGVNGIWLITAVESSGDTELRLRLTNDLGADTQNIRLTATADSLLFYKVIGNNAIRKVVGGKLVKTDTDLIFRRLNRE